MTRRRPPLRRAEPGQRIKPAIVMAMLGVSAAEAQRRLEAADGLLARVIGPASAPTGTEGIA